MFKTQLLRRTFFESAPLCVAPPNLSVVVYTHYIQFYRRLQQGDDAWIVLLVVSKTEEHDPQDEFFSLLQTQHSPSRRTTLTCTEIYRHRQSKEERNDF